MLPPPLLNCKLLPIILNVWISFCGLASKSFTSSTKEPPPLLSVTKLPVLLNDWSSLLGLASASCVPSCKELKSTLDPLLMLKVVPLKLRSCSSLLGSASASVPPLGIVIEFPPEILNSLVFGLKFRV